MKTPLSLGARGTGARRFENPLCLHGVFTDTQTARLDGETSTFGRFGGQSQNAKDEENQQGIVIELRIELKNMLS